MCIERLAKVFCLLRFWPEKLNEPHYKKHIGIPFTENREGKGRERDGGREVRVGGGIEGKTRCVEKTLYFEKERVERDETRIKEEVRDAEGREWRWGKEDEEEQGKHFIRGKTGES